MTRFSVTVRHGPRGGRYHTFELEATDMADALRLAGPQLPAEVAASADLVELRTAPDPASRP